MKLPKAYNPQAAEDKIYALWEKSGCFQPKDDHLQCDNPNTFSIAMPPPNATGELHIGHAMFLTLQDILTRYHRMKGDITLWLPGTDHAAIATQNKVEKILLKKEGKTRHDLGRDNFLRRVNQYVKESQEVIRRQIRKIGSSCDWSRERYTLDAGLTMAVQEVFVRMHNDGLIYRGGRIVNWCPRCASTLADDEVEYKTVKGKFYYLKYGPVIIGTARPETKFLDKTIIVHPQDKRYKHLVGKKFMVPWINDQVEANVIADLAADMSLGTGAMTITPAHSFADFEIAQKYNLPIIQIIDEKGNLTKHAGAFAGINANQARPLIVKKLLKANLIKRIDENYEHNLPVCYRCDTLIEPLVSKQWFIDVNSKFKIPACRQAWQNSKLRKIIGKKQASLKEIALSVVKNGEIDIIPKKFEKIYYHWMNNLRDWCISRQIWFGHRIPVYYKRAKKPIQITYFVHSTSIDNEKGLSSGQVDVKLSPLGQKQSKKLKELIKNQKFDVVFCSDLKRATDTAKIIFDSRLKIIQDKRLREINYGKMTQWESKKIDNLTSSKINKPFPKGESYKQVEDRITDFLSEIIDKYAGKKIAIVAHKAPQLALDVLLKGKTWKQAITSDWRKTSAWQPGWEYELMELTRVSRKKIHGWQQDPDTLDTWFSSGLWTFSTLGWPEETSDLKRFHPTTVMETGYDILFFWVARMILMTTYALGEVPFKTVYLHGLVRDKLGRKMSKSLGNGIDPLDMIKKYGADAVRLSLIIGTTPGNDVRLYEEKIAGYRNFITKIWNISRFILTKSKQSGNSKFQIPLHFGGQANSKFTTSDKWILYELNELVKRVNKNLEQYQFSRAGENIYDFMWHKLADWYIEAVKIENQPHQQQILTYALEKCLILLHPFVPFVTECIWEKLNPPKAEKLSAKGGSLPAVRHGASGGKATRPLRLAKRVGQATKNLKLSKSLLIAEPWLEKIDFEISKTEAQKFIKIQKEISKKRNASAIKKSTSKKETVQLKRYIQSLEARLKDKAFLTKAPAHVIQKEKTRLREALAKLA